MSKFVSSMVAVDGAVNFIMEDIKKLIVEKGGLDSAVESIVDDTITMYGDELEIFFVDSDLNIAESMVTVLNKHFESRAEAEETMTPSFTFNGPVAFGGEVVSTEDIAEAAINNIVKSQKPQVATTNQTNESKGEVENMTTQTTNESVKNLIAGGVSDSEAIAIAKKIREAQAAKSGVAVQNNSIKEAVQMNNRKGSTTVVNNEVNVASNDIPRFGGNQSTANNNTQTQGGNDMNKTADNKPQAQGEGRRSGGNNAAGAQGNAAGFTPSFSFGGNQSDINAAGDDVRCDFDDTARVGGREIFPAAWYLNATRFPILKDFMFYWENRKALPANEYGLTAVNFLNPKNKKYVSYENKYTIIVELAFGTGVNIRLKLTHVTAAMKAEQESNGFKVSKSDWRTGNIKWVQDGNDLNPRYAFSIPNDFVIAVKCSCGKNHNVHAKRATTCEKCGKKHEAIEMMPTPEAAAGVTFVENKYQPTWNPIVLDNFNIVIHKDCLALAMSMAQYWKKLDMHELVVEENK